MAPKTVQNRLLAAMFAAAGTHRNRQALLLLLGCCLCKTLAMHSCITGFGLTNRPYGYIPSIPFLIGASVALIVTCSCVLVAARTGRLRPFSLPIAPPFAILAGGYAAATLLCALVSGAVGGHAATATASATAVAAPALPRMSASCGHAAAAALNAAGAALSGAPSAASGAVAALGALWGAGTALAAVAWMEVLATEASPLALILQLSGALLVSAAATRGLAALPQPAAAVAGVALAAACGIVVSRCRAAARTPKAAEEAGKATAEAPASRAPAAPTAASASCGVGATPVARDAHRNPDGRARRRSSEQDERSHSSASLSSGNDSVQPTWPQTFKGALRQASPLLAAWGFFELVIALVNACAFAGAPALDLCAPATCVGMIGCASATIAFVAVTRRAPNPSFVYLAVLPAVIGAFMLLPFFGGRAGEPLDVIVSLAYAACALLSNFWYIRVAHHAPQHACALAATAYLFMRVMMLGGVAAGFLINGIEAGGEAMRMGVVAAVSAYCLMLAIVQWSRFMSKAKRRRIVVRETFAEAQDRRIRQLAERYGLTARECDVLAELAQGRTAQGAAAHLGISTSTVQGHVKSLYAKLGVNKKQQALDMLDACETEDFSSR